MMIEGETVQSITQHESGLSTLERWQLRQTGVSPTNPIEETLLEIDELAKCVEPVEAAEHGTPSVEIHTNGLWHRFRRFLNRLH